MEKKFDYVTRLDVKFKHLEKIDIREEVDAVTVPWFNQTLTRVNESVVRLGVVEGEYHWHKHDDDDEFFFVIEGQLFIDTEKGTIELNPHQGITIPRGMMHCPRAPQRTVILMMETSTIEPTGD